MTDPNILSRRIRQPEPRHGVPASIVKRATVVTHDGHVVRFTLDHGDPTEVIGPIPLVLPWTDGAGADVNYPALAAGSKIRVVRDDFQEWSVVSP